MTLSNAREHSGRLAVFHGWAMVFAWVFVVPTVKETFQLTQSPVFLRQPELSIARTHKCSRQDRAGSEEYKPEARREKKRVTIKNAAKKPNSQSFRDEIFMSPSLRGVCIKMDVEKG